MPKKQSFEEFLKENGDCPEKIYLNAKTEWQKQVAVEFFKNKKEQELTNQKIDHLEYLLKSILGVTGILAISFIVKIALDYILML